MANPNFFFETLIPNLYGQILGTNQPIDFSGAPYIILPDVIYGNVSFSVRSTSISTTLTEQDGVLLCTAGASGITVTLPTAVGMSGRRYDIKKVDSGAGYVTIDANGSETIDGEFTQVIPFQWASLTLVSNGTNWYFI